MDYYIERDNGEVVIFTSDSVNAALDYFADSVRGDAVNSTLSDDDRYIAIYNCVKPKTGCFYKDCIQLV